MWGASLCEVLHRGSPKTSILVLLSLISGMLIWHAYLACISGMLIWHAYLACSRQPWEELQLFQVSLFLYGPWERAEHPFITAPVPPRWGTASSLHSSSSSLVAGASTSSSTFRLHHLGGGFDFDFGERRSSVSSCAPSTWGTCSTRLIGGGGRASLHYFESSCLTSFCHQVPPPHCRCHGACPWTCSPP